MEELFKAIEDGDAILVEHIISKDPEIVHRKSVPDEVSPLFFALDCGNYYIARILISRGADINSVNSKGWTPLHFAVKRGCKGSIVVLTDEGADLNIGDLKGDTPLHIAARKGPTKIFAILLAAGAKITLMNHKNMTPLDILEDVYEKRKIKSEPNRLWRTK